MIPLLEIKTVPIEIQMKTTSASLEYTRGTAEMEISRSDKGSLEVKSRPIQVKLDTFEPRGSSYRPAAVNTAGQSAQVAQSASSAQSARIPQGRYEATSAYADQGQIQLSARMSRSAGAYAASGSEYTPADIMPNTGLNVEWEDGAMEIRYEMDKLNFDWKIDRGEFKFTPGDIEISVAQKPSITFKYMGGPIYVPRSADPNYQPVDVEA